MSKWRAYPMLVIQIWLLLVGIYLIFEGNPFVLLTVIAFMRMQKLQKQLSA